MSDNVPEVSSTSQVYPDIAQEAQALRWQKLEEKFVETYGRKPDFISRSPGRVNIIGEVRIQLFLQFIFLR